MIYKVVGFAICLLLCYESRGQLCEGNKGLNIFTEGDFGEGISTIFPTDPMIAPGYNYTTQLPDDGQYSLVNNTAIWDLYSAWFPLMDNSEKSTGYMMVVNASFETGAFYEQEITNLCGNTRYEFSADIINLIRTGTANHIDPVVEFLIDGVPQFSTGQVPKNQKWNKYGFTFVTPPNTTSVRLTLRNNAPGGYGNDLALDNISFQPCGSSAFIGLDPDKAILLCIDDDPFELTADLESGNQNLVIQWQYSADGVNWINIGSQGDKKYIHDDFTIGKHYYRYLSAGDESAILNEKCRVISDVVTIEILPLTYSVKDTICEGVPYYFGEIELSESGMYIDTFTSFQGCDSVVFLDLVVYDDPQIQLFSTIEGPNCHYDLEGRFFLDSIANGNGPYTAFIGVDSFDLFDPVNLPIGNYDLTLTDRFQCTAYLRFEIEATQPFEILIPELNSVRYGDCIPMVATANQPIHSIQWIPAELFDVPNDVNVMFTPYKDVEVSVIGDNVNSCLDTARMTIKVTQTNDLELPNVFSPNADGVNDDLIFRPYGKSVQEIKAFHVFDRYGNIIYTQSNLNVDGEVILWRGLDVDVGPGVYVGMMKIVGLDGITMTIPFDITLLK